MLSFVHVHLGTRTHIFVLDALFGIPTDRVAFSVTALCIRRHLLFYFGSTMRQTTRLKSNGQRIPLDESKQFRSFVDFCCGSVPTVPSLRATTIVRPDLTWDINPPHNCNTRSKLNRFIIWWILQLPPWRRLFSLSTFDFCSDFVITQWLMEL